MTIHPLLATNSMFFAPFELLVKSGPLPFLHPPTHPPTAAVLFPRNAGVAVHASSSARTGWLTWGSAPWTTSTPTKRGKPRRHFTRRLDARYVRAGVRRVFGGLFVGGANGILGTDLADVFFFSGFVWMPV